MKKLLIVVSIYFGVTGCTKSFLNTTPSDKVSDANFWKSDADATAGVTAIYDQMQNNYQIYAFMPETEGITPNAWIWSGYKNGYSAIAEGNLLPTVATPVADKWKQLYNGIYKSNLAQEKIPAITMDGTLKNRLLAEARFLRALFYYNLADYYGGVPIIRHTLALGADLPGRDPVADVLKFVTDECDSAAQYLPASYGAADVGRATLGAALTLKARAFLLAKQYDKAAAAAMQVTASPRKVPLLSMVFGLVAVVGGILLELGSSVPISPYVTTISFAIYLVCRLIGAWRHRHGWARRELAPVVG